MPKCTKCGVRKPDAAFGPRRDVASGHEAFCRECRNFCRQEKKQEGRELYREEVAERKRMQMDPDVRYSGNFKTAEGFRAAMTLARQLESRGCPLRAQRVRINPDNAL